MPNHIHTIFLLNITMSLTLAAAIAIVGFGRKKELMLWASGLALHGAAYWLFYRRGEISDILSIVVANTAIASVFALFTEGLLHFLNRKIPKTAVWSPVLLTAIGFTLLIDEGRLRVFWASLIFALQTAALLYLQFAHRKMLQGRGQYIFAASLGVILLLMLGRIGAGLAGYFSVTSITAEHPLQTLTLITSVVSVILASVGLLLMVWEQDQTAIKESEACMRTLFECSSEAVMMLDEHGFLDCNPATLKIFGCQSKQEFLAKSVADLSPALQADGLDSASLAALKIKTAFAESYCRFEWLHKRLDSGKVFQAEVLLNAMHINGRHLLQAVVRDISEAKSLQRRLQREAQLDYLTELNNRRHFMALAEQEQARAIRYDSTLSLLMMDIDHFKLINDRYGHQGGDQTLQTFADICRQTLREIDIAGRIGGEEFAVLLPETPSEEAYHVAERLRQRVAEAKVTTENQTSFTFSVSIGIASLSSEQQSIVDLLNAADRALYAAKHAGRNRIATATIP